MDLGLRNKVALVAASSRGLGKAVAAGLAAEGASVVICSRDEKTLAETSKQIASATGSRVLSVQADVSQPADIARLVQTALTELGTIHILINNAGGPPVETFENLSDQQWQAGLQLNLMSTIRLTRAVLPVMQKQKWGRIITINSIAGKQPISDLLISSTIRPGLIGLSKALSAQYAREGILINTICPGFIMTDRQKEITEIRAAKADLTSEEYLREHTQHIPIGRYGTPEEFASLVVFLPSERASYISGATFSVDGGMSKGLL